MAGRPRAFDQDIAVDRFLELFWSKGFSDTSIDDLQTAAGIQRGSFYAAFQDKEAVFLQCLELYTNRYTAQALAVLRGSTEPRIALSGFVRFVGGFLSQHCGHGCLLLTSITQPSPTMIKGVERFYQRLAEPISNTCLQVEAMGQLNNNETAGALQAYVFIQVFGLNALARSGATTSAIEQSAAISADYIQFGIRQ